MKIGVIGAGMVGGALTKAFAKRGHDVMVAARDPSSDKMKALTDETGARAGTNAEAAAHGDVIALASPWGATEEILRSMGDLTGKILLDATNPIKDDFSGLDRGHETSGGEAVQAWAPNARVVKAMNQIGFELMDAPRVDAGRPLMFIAGDDADAKKTVGALVESLGFHAEDCGDLAMSRYIEPLAWLWINRAMKQQKSRHFAFVLSEAAPGATNPLKE